MNILLAALGLGPFVQAPENAQFVTGLAKALSQLGHEVSVAAPYLPAYEQAGLLMGRRLYRFGHVMFGLAVVAGIVLYRLRRRVAAYRSSVAAGRL